MRIVRLIVIALLFVFANTAFSAKIVPFPDLLKPELIRVNKEENRLYITEGHNIYIYSLKDFSLIKKFGKRGEGPQEFLIGGATFGWLWIVIQPDHIFIHSMGKISFYSKEGEFRKETRIGIVHTPVFHPMENQFVGVGFYTENNTNYWATNIYDSNLKKVKEIYRYERGFYPGKPIDPYNIKTPDFYVYDNKIFVADTVKTGAIYVFDKNGNKLYSINPEYEKVKVTQMDIENSAYYYNIGAHKNFYNTYKNRFEFPRYFPAMRFMIIADDKIYVMTYKKKNDKTQFMILDLKGKLLKKVFLPVNGLDVQYYCPFEIKDNKLYHFVELEEEGCELHITEIEK